MAYQHELITEEDKRTIDFDKVTRSMGSRSRPVRWTVDRRTGNFLLCLFWGNEEDQRRRTYAFRWMGKLIGFSFEWIESRDSERTLVRWRLRATPPLHPELEKQRKDIYADFEQALLCEERDSFPAARMQVQFA